jgi:hypothetical protein
VSADYQWPEDYIREIDGNGHIPELSSGSGDHLNETVTGKVCGCCQRLRSDPQDIAMFGTLLDAGGKTWHICGKCISAMWRKRAPKLEPLV